MCISNCGNRRPVPTGAYGMLQDRSSMSSMLKPDGMNTLKRQLPGSMPPRSPTSTVEGLGDESAVVAPQKAKTHITVQHDYHDHSNDSCTDYQEDHPARGGVTTPFPLKLHEMLDAVAARNLEHIVSWQPHGRCFLVHKPKEFVELLPLYFKLSKIASFQRQLNLYGFQRLTKGRDRGGYYHELFLKNKVFLAHSIQRIKVKGTGVRARSNPDQEPDFWSMPWVTSTTSRSQDSKQSAVSHGSNMFFPKEAHSQTPAQVPLNTTSPLHEQFIPDLIPMASSSNCAMSSLPTPYAALEDDFDIDVFDDTPFQCLDPFQPNEVVGTWAGENEVEEILHSEAEAFFDDFDFPTNLGNEIEDDSVFGNLLQQVLE